jgi:hypothetical protein
VNRPPSIACRPLSPVLRASLTLALAALAGGAIAQETPAAGKVVFVSGPAQLVAADGRSRTVSAGAEIRQGDQVVTGRDAYVHLRMVDNAFVAVRPESRLAVQLYEYPAANPSASRIKLQLESGNTRTVSGKGGEAAKQNYRFNTPMAAIGLRGTDYTVVSTAQETRVSVSRGAVAVTPLGEGCAASALGPCATTATRDLSAGIPHAYLQVTSDARIPVLVRPEQDPQGGNGQNPAARPEEPRAELSGDLQLADSKDAASLVAADRLAAGLLPVEPPPPPQLVWGRWSNYAQGEGAPAVAELLQGREITYGNQVFGLLRQQGKVSLPAQGGFDFKLAGGEAYVVNGTQVDPARVAGGKFNIDFNQRTFATQLAVQHAGGMEQLQAKGAVHWQGNLIADRALSNMNLAGVVSNGGTEAAYLFDKALTSGGLLGAVRWVR